MEYNGRPTHIVKDTPMVSAMPTGVIKRLSQTATTKGNPPSSAEQFAQLTNTEVNGNTISFALKNIPRKDKEQLRDIEGMKKCCEFQYVYKDENQEECRKPGIVLYRLFSGCSQKYEVVDLYKANRLCGKCSFENQRPVTAHSSGLACPYREYRTGQMPGQYRTLVHYVSDDELKKIYLHEEAMIAVNKEVRKNITRLKAKTTNMCFVCTHSAGDAEPETDTVDVKETKIDEETKYKICSMCGWVAQVHVTCDSPEERCRGLACENVLIDYLLPRKKKNKAKTKNKETEVDEGTRRDDDKKTQSQKKKRRNRKRVIPAGNEHELDDDVVNDYVTDLDAGVDSETAIARKRKAQNKRVIRKGRSKRKRAGMKTVDDHKSAPDMSDLEIAPDIYANPSSALPIEATTIPASLNPQASVGIPEEANVPASLAEELGSQLPLDIPAGASNVNSDEMVGEFEMQVMARLEEVKRAGEELRAKFAFPELLPKQKAAKSRKKKGPRTTPREGERLSVRLITARKLADPSDPLSQCSEPHDPSSQCSEPYDQSSADSMVGVLPPEFNLDHKEELRSSTTRVAPGDIVYVVDEVSSGNPRYKIHKVTVEQLNPKDKTRWDCKFVGFTYLYMYSLEEMFFDEQELNLQLETILKRITQE